MLRALHSGGRGLHYDLVVVGGGIVGLATAQELIYRHPSLKFAVLEKEEKCNRHQTGHNSGVIHAGIYYKPGSLMAKLCIQGLTSTYKYCDKHRIPYKKCGKLIVATSDVEVKRLKALFLRAQENRVPNVKYLKSLEEIREIEPYCKGLEAIHSPETGIVDWENVADKYAENFETKGGKIYLKHAVVNMDISDANVVRIKCSNGTEITSDFVLACAGLYSDRVAMMTGNSSEPKIVPFRGEYLLLSPEKAKLIRGNIYPVPDPAFPFLGVHFTPRMNGEVWLGPNAVLATRREGYSWSQFSLQDILDVMKYPGFYKLARKYARYGSGEILRSLFPTLIVPELKKFIPEIERKDIKHGPAGVRAQAMSSDGNLVADFIFDSSGDPRVLHCRNAPSPAATSSLAIGQMVADKVEKQFSFPPNGNAVLY